ncbi:MAG: response regulator [Ignavibacteriaceae bacterium]|nr:response regulator [Ignavibacteriaceae bacterium]
MNVKDSYNKLLDKLPIFKPVFKEVKNQANSLVKVPPRLMAYLVAILSLIALFIETNFFPANTFEIFTVRFTATVIALSLLVLLNSKSSEKRLVTLYHVLLLTLIISSGLMIYLIPSTLLLNTSFIGLMIFTSALLLSWEVRNQIIVAGYYNLIFAAVLVLTNMKTFFFPFMAEALIFVFVLSVVSLVACTINYKMRILEEQKNSEIKKSEHKYRSIISNSLEGIFQSTIDGKWITVNKSMAQIFGYNDEAEMMSNSVEQIYADEKDRIKIINELKKSGKVENWRIKLKRKDGSIAVVRLNDRLVQNENGEMFLEGNIYDITEQVKVEEEHKIVEKMLKQEKEKTEKLAQEALRISGTKSKLLANLSHEIRTPMNGILGFLSLIEAGAYSNESELKTFSSSARQSAESLLEIINSVLDLTKIEAGKIKADNVRFSLPAVIDQSISVVSIRAIEKNIKIIKDIPESTEKQLIGDMVKLRQIFTNLLNNAVKFTTDGEIKISVRTLKHLNNEVELHASITDTGIGIAASKLDDLFKPYSQVGDFYEGLTNGTGLGLVICKEYAELLGGKICVSSVEGEGSSFSFMIKCKAQSKDDIISQKKSEREIIETQITERIENFNGNGFKEKREKFRVLLAEDNLINQKVTIKILNTFGFNVTAVSDGQEAVSALNSGGYDIILMDLQMPKVDGFKATEKIRNLQNSNKDIPIIALTAHALIGDKEKCLNAGMTDYISKPVSGQDLVKKIDVLLNIQTDDSIQMKGTKQDLSPLLDKERLKNVSLGDSEFEKDILTSFLDDINEKYSSLIDFMLKREIDKIVEIVHAIKGSSYSIGAVKVGDEAYAIELSGKNNDWVNVTARIEKFSKIIEDTNQEIRIYLNGK